jgi:hypothetical protein
MADTLRTLDVAITDESLVLNLLRGLSPRFDRVTPILTRMKPFPTFAEVKNDPLLEELHLSATLTSTPATVLYSASRPAPSDSGGLHRTSAPPSPGALQQPPGSGGVTAAVARVVAMARRVAGEALRVALSGHPSTTHGLAPSTCGPGHPRVHRLLAPPPPPLTGFLCRSTACCAFVSSPTSSGDPSPPGASSPAHLGALDKWVECLVSR